MNELSEEQQMKDEAFTVIQNFLKDPPVIIWGSGATIPYGLPSMNDLNKKLKSAIPSLQELEESENLEAALEKNIV